jgi:hypothetical protein
MIRPNRAIPMFGTSGRSNGSLEGHRAAEDACGSGSGPVHDLGSAHGSCGTRLSPGSSCHDHGQFCQIAADATRDHERRVRRAAITLHRATGPARPPW